MWFQENRSRRGRQRRGKAGCAVLAGALLGLACWPGGLAWAAGAGSKSKSKPGDRPGAPWVQLKLESLGVPGLSSAFLGVGSSILTVNFLDDSHLLVTYSLRSLVPRLVGDPEDHDDRMVAGEVVELPGGKILARTEWHMHDHGRYLWSLGRGRFVLRIGDRLYTMAPLTNLKTAEPFLRTTFPGPARRPIAIFISQDDGVLTVESALPMPKRREVVLGDVGSHEPQRAPTLVQFYRLRGEGSSQYPLQLKAAGGAKSDTPFYVPVDADGFLWAEEAAHNHWAMTFDEFGGKTLQLGAVESSCQPRLQMVSHSEFVALTCQGSDDHVKMASFGLDGKETWEEDMGDLGRPAFAVAPAAGRFAVLRETETGEGGVLAPNGGPNVGPGATGPTQHQELRVYQNASGDLLLKVECTPVFKSQENFDLAEDGTLAAVVREGAIAVYKLPPLKKQDQEDIAEVERFAPPATDAPVLLTRMATEPASVAAAETADAGTGDAKAEIQPQAKVEAKAEGGSPGAAAAPPLTAASGAGEGDEAAPAVRPVPTLLKPGEKAEFPSKNSPN